MNHLTSANNNPNVIIATRGSQLALWQTGFVQQLLDKQGVKSSAQILKTTGDKIQDRPLHQIGGKGVFIKELEQALFEKKADLAVHSLKDLPACLNKNFSLSCFLPRDDSADVLICPKNNKLMAKKKLEQKDFAALCPSQVATGSLRRQSLLKLTCPKVEVISIRGNVNTRIAKLKSGEYPSLILAKASLLRLGIDDSDLNIYDLCPKWWVPCAGQGTLVVESLASCDKKLLEKLQNINCGQSEKSSLIERKILEFLGASCELPVGIRSVCTDNKISCWVFMVSLDLKKTLRVKKDYFIKDSVDKIAKDVCLELKSKGADIILESYSLPEIFCG
jgi:hydroxymethylbilane synthase